MTKWFLSKDIVNSILCATKRVRQFISESLILTDYQINMKQSVESSF